MFEKFHARLDNTEGYSQDDLDIFNAALESYLLDTFGDGDIIDWDDVHQEAGAFSDRYLTDDPTDWLSKLG